MRTSFVPRGLLIVAGLCAAMFGACSSSDNSATGSFGSLSDPEFQEIQGEVTALVDSILIAFGSGLNSYNELPAGGNDEVDPEAGPIDPDAENGVTYEYIAGDWHHFIIINNDNTYVRGVNDSIQFRSEGVPQESAENADAVDLRHHWGVNQINVTQNYKNISGDASIQFEGLDGVVASVGGSYSYNAEINSQVDTTTTNNTFNFSAIIYNVEVPQVAGQWGSGCPSTGTVNFSSDQAKIVTNPSSVDTMNTTWSGSARFEDGSAQISLSNGVTSWVIDHDVCQPGQ